MRGRFLSDKEILADTKRLLKNLSRRFDRIGARIGEFNITTQAVYEQYAHTVYTSTTNLKNMTPQELRTLHANLEYIEQLKTTTIRGAKESEENFNNIAQYLRGMSKETQDNFWKLYGVLYHDKSVFEYYKYDILDVAVERFEEAKDKESAYNNFATEIKDLYDKTFQNVGGIQATDEQLRSEFTKALRNLLRES